MSVPITKTVGCRILFSVLTFFWASYGQEVTYSYDKAGRLIEARYAQGKVITYTYDTMGNIVSTDLSSFTYADPNTRWISHVTRVGGGFETHLTMTNQSDDAGDIILQPYRANGSRLASVTVSIPGLSYQTRTIMDVFNTTDVSHFSVSGSTDVFVTASYRLASGLGATAHINESAIVGTEFAIYPGEWEFVFDGLALINRFTETSEILMEQVVMDGGRPKMSKRRAYSVEPYEKKLVVLGDEFQAVENGFFRITSSQPFTPLFLRGTPPGISPGYLYLTQPIFPGDLETERWLPHVTPSDAVFQTTLYLTNFGPSTATMTLSPYGVDGTDLSQQTMTVPADGSLILPSQTAFPALNVSHFVIEGSGECVVTAGYRIASLSGATAHVNEGAFEVFATSDSYEIFQGEWDRVFDGLAIVNLGTSSAAITGEQTDAQNSTLLDATITTGLVPNGKFLLVFDDVFEDRPGTKIRISSNQPSTAVFLRGTPPGVVPGYLFQTLPLKSSNQPGLIIEDEPTYPSTYTAFCPQSQSCLQLLEPFSITNISQERVQVNLSSTHAAIAPAPSVVTLAPNQSRQITPRLSCQNLGDSEETVNWAVTLDATYVSGRHESYQAEGSSSIGPPRSLWADMVTLIDNGTLLADPLDVWGGLASSTYPDPVGELTNRGIPGLASRVTQCPDPADISYSCSYLASMNRQSTKSQDMAGCIVAMGAKSVFSDSAMKGTSETEDYLIFVVALRTDIPWTEPNWHLQFGFVFDSDGNSENNFAPAVPDANDFFLGTDRWYLVDYDPQTGWQATVADARDGDIQGVESDAFMIIQDNVVMAFIPAREFSDSNPGYRTTVMMHRGDRGLNAPHEWFGDQNPPIDQPLALFYSSP